MANVSGRNYKKAYESTPTQFYDVGFNGGRVHVLIDDFADAVAADVIKIGKLPKGAKVLSVNHVGMGAAPTFNVTPMQLVTDETLVEITVGATPAAGVASAWVTYTLA